MKKDKFKVGKYYIFLPPYIDGFVYYKITDIILEKIYWKILKTQQKLMDLNKYIIF